MEDFKEPQSLNDEQHLRELQQRINAKAQNLIKWQRTEGRINRWVVIACCIVAIVIIVAILVDFYDNHFSVSGFSAYLGIFIGTALIVYFILKRIMRCYLTRMKNSSSALQYYLAVKRLITTHKLSLWLPLAVAAAVLCSPFKFGNISWGEAFLSNISIVLGTILGSWMSHWFLDDEFRWDIEELRDIVKQEGAA